MNMFLAYVLVFALAAAPFFEAVIIAPLAVLLGMHVVPSILLAIVGNLLTVYIVILFVDKMKTWFSRNKDSSRRERRTERARRIWEKYGVVGISLIGPFIIGSHLSAFLCLLFGASKRVVTIWMTISIAAWCIVLGILASYGITIMNVENPFLERIFQVE